MIKNSLREYAATIWDRYKRGKVSLCTCTPMFIREKGATPCLMMSDKSISAGLIDVDIGKTGQNKLVKSCSL